ncbi:MAG: hypothetical protein RI926_267 [Actinomycetota bacterium]|jgi:hypothetical protein
MKRTTPAPLIGLFLLGAVASYLLELVVQSQGGFIYVPPLSLAFTLGAVAVGVVLLAIPIRRKVTGKRKEPIDSFYAAKVVALAKASSFAGSLLFGLGAGVLIYVLGRPIAPNGAILTNVIAQLVAAAVLITAGLIAERLCVLPPDDMDKSDKEVAGEPAA